MHLLLKPRLARRLVPIFLLCFSSLTQGFSQTVTLSVEKMPLEKVFLLIEKQTRYNFIYSSEALSQSNPVTVDVKNEQLERVLSLCFRDQPLTYVIDKENIVVKSRPKQVIAIRELRGKVVNENGNPVPGLTVSIINTNKATPTNDNGEFVFNDAPANCSLLVTGAEIDPKEVNTGIQSQILIVVKAHVGALDETIVIAYGKTTRRYENGTAGKITSEQIGEEPISNLLSALSGTISGLQVTQNSGVPGAFITVRLRGQNSLANGNNPLYIVDGVPFPSGSLNGSFGGGSNVNASPLSNIDPSDIERIDVLKDADATAIYGSRGANGVILITTKKGVAGKTRLTLKTYAGVGTTTREMDLLNTSQYLMMRREAFSNDGVTPTVANARDLLLWDTTRYTDWQKQLIGGTMHISDVNVSVTGGTAQTQFLVGGIYHKETTVFPGSFGENKYSANMNIVHHSDDKRFFFNSSVIVVYRDNLLPITDFSTQINLPPDAPKIYSADGTLNWENSTWVNPLAAIYKTYRTKANNLIGDIDVGYKILRDLTLKVTGGYNYLSSADHTEFPRKANNPVSAAGATAGFGSTNFRTLIGEPQLTYEHQIGKGRLTALAGCTFHSTHQFTLYQLGGGFSTDLLLNSVKAASTIRTLSETDIQYRYLGFFGRLNYDWSKKYLASFTFRRDGSSRYGPANRFANFGSGGLAWIFTNEKFLKQQHVLSFGKLKFSAGITGNDQIGDYQYLNLFTSYSYPYQGITPFYPVQLYNPDFSWEKVKKLELGFDMGMFDDRIIISATGYHDETSNQLISYSLPVQTGFSSILKNIPAKIVNSGIEVEVNTINLKSKKWSWQSSFNLTIPKNKLVAFPDLQASSYADYYVLGQPLSISKTLLFTGVDPGTGNYSFRDFNNDGVITFPEDQQAIVNTAIRWYGGLQNEIRYGRLSLSILFQFTHQLFAPNYLSRFSRPGLISNEPVWILDRWQKPGDTKPIQRFDISNPATNSAFINYILSNAAYSNASFIRLKNVYCSWDIKSKDLARAGFTDCRVFLSGQNILTRTKYQGLDPETQSLVPPVKLITGGIQFTL